MSVNPFAGVIAIDGPSASGKTTVARMVAEQLGATVFDTGALYRAVTLASIRRGIAPSDGAALAELAESISIDIAADGRVLIDGEDVSGELRTPQVDRWVSDVSAHPAVRTALLARTAHDRERTSGCHGWTRYCHGRHSGSWVEGLPRRERGRAGAAPIRRAAACRSGCIARRCSQRDRTSRSPRLVPHDIAAQVA